MNATARIAVSYRRRLSSKKGKAAKFEDFAGEFALDEVGSADVLQTVEARRMVFDVVDAAPGYELKVIGFDPNRDLELRLQAEDV